METVLQFKIDNLKTKVLKDRKVLGKEAAIDVAEKINNLLKTKDEIRIVFAAAPSQNEFLEELTKQKIDWERITAFHMDEYIGLWKDSPQLFSFYLRTNLFNKVKFKNVYYLNSVNEDNKGECERYAKLLNENPIDIICLGIGENGHIAFNDPPVADFNDTETVKIVELDLPCREQQVNDGCFSTIEDVPKYALTLTIPALLSADYLSVVVPGERKANAVYKTLFDEISTKCPATILRNHKNVVLYLEQESFALVKAKIKNQNDN